MNSKIERLLKNQGGNYIFPFFWQHGEEEEVLREYMKVIDESNLKAVCVESRPHPDYCGPKWWHDMDIILEEARNRGMKVWILDDSHFPTGFANGAMADKPDELCRQSLCCRIYDCTELKMLHIVEEELQHPVPFVPTQIEMFAGEKEPRKFDDDKLLGLYAVCNGAQESRLLDLNGEIKSGVLDWEVPEGRWKVCALHLSRNMGFHRNYINMMSLPSCRVLIDAVYEPHYAHYGADFGKTIAGFFSDEPELGNGHLYEKDTVFGADVDFPWSEELEEELEKRLGSGYVSKLIHLWEQDASGAEAAKVRYAYMDAVTRLVKKDFSEQMGNWCRSHGTSYIGHVIEDNNQHARTGSSLGHYYRGLAGQDMSGIDDIGGQVFPQGEDVDYDNGPFAVRNGEFYHYMLGKLANSAAAIEPLKKGNSMCEIFGAYGWGEGVRLEKYLIDHFAVRGINHYVPHAFSPKEFPDQDCPPHFYAHGNNPQYRHFGSLMAYTNRVCEMISGGRHVAPAAVIYHGEGEWAGACMYSHKIGHQLCDAQIDYDYIPQDVFAEREDYRTVIIDGMLKVNTQEYKFVLVPSMKYVTAAFAAAVKELETAGVTVLFVDKYPQGICDVDKEEEKRLLVQLPKCRSAEFSEIVSILKNKNIPEIIIAPKNNRIRYYHYEEKEGSAVYLFVNEGTESWEGTVRLSDSRTAYFYQAWENCLEPADYDGEELKLVVEPLKSKILILDHTISSAEEIHTYLSEPLQSIIHADREADKKREGTVIETEYLWKRSICRSIAYPQFGEPREIILPDKLAEEEPEFSGFVRYENTFIGEADRRYLLEITDAHEGVEVFVNGKSLGIQIVPVYLYDMSGAVKNGENTLVIEVATTLEREMAKCPNAFGQMTQPSALSGITGEVLIYQG